MSDKHPLAAILKAVCRNWPQGTPCLNLGDGFEKPKKEKQPSGGFFYFPKTILPPNLDYQEIKVGKDSFPPDISSHVISNHLFLIPPICSRRFLPRTISEQFPRRNLEEIVVIEALRQAQAGSQILFILPSSSLLLKSSEEFRQILYSLGTPIQFIETHKITPLIHPAFMFYLVLIEAELKQHKPLRYFSIPDNTPVETIAEDFKKLQKRNGGKTKFGFVSWDHPPPELSLTYWTLLPELKEVEEDMVSAGDMKPLCELFEIKLGVHLIANAKKISPESNKNCIPLLSGKSLSGGTINLEKTLFINKQESSPSLLQPGDIVIRKMRSVPKPLEPFVIPDGFGPMVFDSTIICFRAKKPLASEDVEFFIAFLKSETVSRQLSALSPSMTINPKDLASLSVPVMDGALRAAVRSLSEAQKKFQGWSDEAYELKKALFSLSKVGKARDQIVPIGRLNRLRLSSAIKADDLSYRIRTQYPHPIAFRWRTVEASHSDLEGYVNILECAETLAAFLAILALAIAREFKLEIKALDFLAQKLSATKHGVDFGSWLSILSEFRGLQFSDEAMGVFVIRELLSSLKEGGFDLFSQLSSRRNDQSHHRGPKGSQVSLNFQTAKGELENLLPQFEFLSEYPLRYVEDTKLDTLRNQNVLIFRDLMGDHPLAPLLSIISSNSRIEKGSLYLNDRREKWFLLRPFLTRHECPTSEHLTSGKIK